MSDPAGSRVQRARGQLVEAVSVAACHLPEAPLVALAEAGGELWYRIDARRAEQGRRNLGRVCAWLGREGVGPERARRAGVDPAALDRFVRSASRHHARYYLEVLRTPALTPARVRRRLVLDDPAILDAIDGPGPLILIGLHLGSLEIPAIYLADRFRRRAVAPMETIDDPVLQRWFERTRSGVGVTVIPMAAARREFQRALERGEIAGAIADRDIGGGGIEVPFFGHPAPFPVGPALASVESGAPAYAAGVRRLRDGRYAAHVVPITAPPPGTRRERVTAFLAAQAAAFEQIIAMAPDQWWSAFFPIWRDLAVRAEEGDRGVAA